MRRTHLKKLLLAIVIMASLTGVTSVDDVKVGANRGPPWFQINHL